MLGDDTRNCCRWQAKLSSTSKTGISCGSHEITVGKIHCTSKGKLHFSVSGRAYVGITFGAIFQLVSLGTVGGQVFYRWWNQWQRLSIWNFFPSINVKFGSGRPSLARDYYDATRSLSGGLHSLYWIVVPYYNFKKSGIIHNFTFVLTPPSPPPRQYKNRIRMEYSFN